MEAAATPYHEAPAGSGSDEKVPFLDLGVVHRGLKDDLLEQISKLVDSSAFINGPAVAAFEQAYATYCGLPHCVGVASGIDALRLSLEALDVGPGDEVIVPAMTFFATFEAVSQVGAVPVPVEVSLEDYGMLPAAVTDAIGPKTRAVMPVHLYGQLCDLGGILACAERAKLDVIEDACQAHGAERDGLRPGERSAAAAYSFYPGKNLGAMGDAGAVVTTRNDIAEETLALREHGQRAKYQHYRIGYTARLDTIQALVLAEKLPHLDAWNDDRSRVAANYLEALEGIGDLVLPRIASASRHAWHLFVVLTANPEALGEYLAARGVATGRHYPQLPHESEAYAALGIATGTFPAAERVARSALSLPMFPGMTSAQQERVVDAVREYFARA